MIPDETPVATIVVVVTLLLTAVGTAAAATTQDDAGREFAIDLREDGSATVSLTVPYELDSPEERDAFTSLRDDEAAREQFRTQFATRLDAVAADAQARTGRSMSVRDSEIAVDTVGDTGIVTLSVTWDGLAAVDGDRLVVTEPFASGFTTDRPVTVTAPDGYDVTGVSPQPDDREAGTLAWSAGTSFEGFEVTMTPTANDGTVVEDTARTVGTVAETGAGFGAAAALLAVAAVVGLAARRR